MSLAQINLIGNLGGDPETRYTQNGKMNVNFSMAVSRRFTDSSGQQQERTAWYRVTAWGRLAETVDKLAQQNYIHKGKQVFVTGRLEPRDWTDQQGQTRTSLDVFANEVQLLGGRRDEAGGGGDYQERSESPAGNFESTDLDDVPF